MDVLPVTLQTQQPVERGQREHHHGEDGMAPGGDLLTDFTHRNQVDQAEQARDPAAQRADASKAVKAATGK